MVKGYGAIPIDVLKTLIGRLETDKNPINIIPVGDDRYNGTPTNYLLNLIKISRMGSQDERKKFYDVLDRLNDGTGQISFDVFKAFVKKAQAANHEST